MLPPVASILRASAPVLAIVSDRIFRHGDAPQNVTKPYITWSVSSDSPYNQLSDVASMDMVSIDVSCWHPTDSGAEDLAVLVSDAIERHAYMGSITVDEREPETKLYNITMQFDWHMPVNAL
jgi:hypothetical protein